MKQLSPPDALPDYVGKCKKCGAVYQVAADEFEVDGFKTSGFFFDGSAVCEERFFFQCPHCLESQEESYLFQKDMEVVTVDG